MSNNKTENQEPEMNNETAAVTALLELLNEGVLQPQELTLALIHALNVLAVAFPDDLIRPDGQLHTLGMQASHSQKGDVFAAVVVVVNKDREKIMDLLKHIDPVVVDVAVDNVVKMDKNKVH